MSDSRGFVYLRRDGVSVLFDARGPVQPTLVHWGADLGELTVQDCEAVALATIGAIPHAVLDGPVPKGLLPERAVGYRGRPGLAGHRHGADFAPQLGLVGIERQASDPDVVFALADEVAGLAVRSRWKLEAAGLLQVQHEVTNTGTAPYQLAEVGIVLPVPPVATEILDLTGRWCRERAPQRRPLQLGAWTRENRRGRTAADSSYVTVVGSAGFSNRSGSVWAVHLGWSGDQVSWAESQPDGTRALGVAELLTPGEIELQAAENYTTPTAFAVYSDAGLDGVADRFHRYVRSRPTHPRTPRPAVLNTWEAVYFDQSLDRLKGLADRAAEVGIERFVLDDGWFGGRRDDTTSLGDWYVSTDIWPTGLEPLITYVTGLGLKFGLWVEPEMINPDSDLFRAHPDWVLAAPGRLPPISRHQHVIDLANPDAFAYIFSRLDALLTEYDISYLKWDHNRDLVNAQHDGRAGIHRQTLAIYRLLDQLKDKHPAVEIESCASGGARVDLGILARTDRVWASDCNDALERQQIQRWTALLLPPELIGTHVGPLAAHTTGRTHSLSFRIATALFGHFGVEWDIVSATPEDRAGLAAAIGVYQRLRPMLHSGTVVNVDHPDPAATVAGVVANDQSTALFSYVQLASGLTEAPVPVRFAGLDPARRYAVTPVLLAGGPALIERTPAAWIAAGGITLSGQALQTVGLQLPILQPEQSLLLELASA